jgi:glycosyltransferase involved in cell wall biosynthesis
MLTGAGGIAARRPLRVLLVGLGLELSGSGRFLSGLAVGLDRLGFETTLFVVRGGPLQSELQGTGVKLVIASPDLPESAGRLRLGVLPFFRLHGHIRHARPDVVHTNLFGVDAIGRTAAMFAPVPVLVSTQHDLNPRPWFVRAFRRLTAPRISATIACSDAVADFCRAELAVPEDRLVTIENGIDVGRLAAAVTPAHADAPRFLALGALLPVKNQATLIRAFAILAEKRPDASLDIVGAGPLQRDLERLVASLGLQHAVHIRPPSPDIVGLLREADVFVQPSLREGLPQAVLEAMAAGKPVIASDVSSLAAVLDGGSCGLLVAPGDIEALAAAMLALADDPRRAERLGTDALARARERYSVERMAREYAALYEGLAEAQARR